MSTILRRSGAGPQAARGGAAPAVATGVALLAAVAFPLAAGTNVPDMGLATEALVYGLVTLSLNLLMGYGGQVSIGHGGLLAVGAYATAILASRYNLPFILVLAGSGVAAGVVGLLLGLPAGRLRSHYLAVATLGFGVAVPQIALNLGSVTGGFTGIIVPAQSLGGISLSSPVPLYYLALAILAASALAIRSLLASPTGRRFMAVRDSEEAAPALGINPGRSKVILFTTSAFFCGLAGSLFALNNSIVEPDSFSFSLSLFFFAAVIVGGLASMWGSLAGAALLVIVQQESSSLGGFSETILGGAVVVVLLLVPGGLAALPRRLYGLVQRTRRRYPGDATGAAALPAEHPSPASPVSAPEEG